MKSPALPLMFAAVCGICASTAPIPAAAGEFKGEFSFAVIAHPFKTTDESTLRAAIAETDEDNLAFVVANGIKSDTEPCSDKIYGQRKSLFDGAKNGLIVSVAASDWSECRYANGRSAAVERLNRLRDLFFSDDFSAGASKIPVIRQSAVRKFRGYGENARWEFGNILFATINLPSNNNRYLAAAGRNGEFEDRLIANRDWLQRLALFAANKKMRALVLFCDGDPVSQPRNSGGRRDGFAETRLQFTALAKKFSGKILVIHDKTDAGTASDGIPSGSIRWTGSLGELKLGTGWTKLTALPSSRLFSVSDESTEAKNN